MKGLILTTIAIGLCGAALTPSNSINEPVRLRITANKIEAPIRHARDDSALAWGINPKIFRAVEIIESSGGKRLRKYEPDYAKRLLRKKPRYVESALTAGWNLKQLATSYGPMHVLGVNYYEMGFSPNDVDDFSLNYDLASNYLYKCKTKNAKWRGALLCYNGGGDPGYPVRVARVAIALGLRSKPKS